MIETEQAKISRMLTEHSLPLHGFVHYAALEGRQIHCRGAGRLPAAARTVIPVLFPYRFPEDGGPARRNLSRYACVPDYHQTAGRVLSDVAKALEEAFPANVFEPFIDNSPLPEVTAAALAGLGVVGDNGLLIHPVYGSYVFIGALVTDWAMAGGEADEEPAPLPRCPGCGRCAEACPAGVLHPGGRGPDDRDRCLSALTQKKGELTKEEERLIRTGGLVWGCDRCQEVCPLNRRAVCAPHPCFGGIYAPILTPRELDALQGKAYGWRGRKVPERNLRLLPPQEGGAD
ncbi:MAG: epoxyqueuosine reductase [Clostridiales bacterium]|nr:epoxyqueuosine reductase [Clostridiales bacterium]